MSEMSAPTQPTCFLAFQLLGLLSRLGLHFDMYLGRAKTSMAGIDARIAERYIQNAQGALLGDLEFARTCQWLVILAPLDLGAIVPLHRTLDLHLGAKEDHTSTAHLQSDLGLLRIVLNVCRITDLYHRLGILRRARLDIAGLLVGWLDAGTHRFGSFDLMFLCHNLLALDLAIFDAIATGVRALGPFPHLPAHWAVQDIAILTISWRWLRAHAVGHHHGVLATTCHLVYALHLTRLYPYAATLRARRVVRVVPAWRTRTIVAGAYTCLWFRLRGAEEWRDHTTIILTHTIDDQLLDATQARGTARGVALLAPHIRLARLRYAHLDGVAWKLIIVAVRGQHAGLLHATFDLVVWLGTLAQGVIHSGHGA